MRGYFGLGIVAHPWYHLDSPWLLGFLQVLPDNLAFPRWSLPTLKATSFKSPPSIGLLELLAPCDGVPELLASPTGLLKLLAPCGQPELLAPPIGLLKLLAACGGVPELLAPPIGLLELLAPCGGVQNCWLPAVVCQNCWLPGRWLWWVDFSLLVCSCPHWLRWYCTPQFRCAPGTSLSHSYWASTCQFQATLEVGLPLKAVSFKSPHLLELLAPCGGVPKLLSPWEVTFMCRFLATGESQPPVDFSAAPVWLQLPALRVGLPELLAPGWERPTFWWWACIAGPLFIALTIFFCRSLMVHISPTWTGEFKVTTSRAPYRWKSYIWRGGAQCPKGIVCLLPPHCGPRHDTSHLGFGGPELFLPS
jgi:hypothetical protein